jgi:hypothetical protein
MKDKIEEADHSEHWDNRIFSNYFDKPFNVNIINI